MVALRNLKDANGNTIEPSDAFRAYRDNLINTGPMSSSPMSRTAGPTWRTCSRARGRRDRALEPLPRLGLHRRQRAQPERAGAPHPRRRVRRGPAAASAARGHRPRRPHRKGAAPQFTVTGMSEPASDPRIARRVEGKITVPCYLNTPGCPPGSRFNFLPGRRSRPGTPPTPSTSPSGARSRAPRSSPRRPRAALSLRARAAGLGERGGRRQHRGDGEEHNIMFCATDWAGSRPRTSRTSS